MKMRSSVDEPARIQLSADEQVMWQQYHGAMDNLEAAFDNLNDALAPIMQWANLPFKLHVTIEWEPLSEDGE